MASSSASVARLAAHSAGGSDTGTNTSTLKPPLGQNEGFAFLFPASPASENRWSTFQLTEVRSTAVVLRLLFTKQPNYRRMQRTNVPTMTHRLYALCGFSGGGTSKPYGQHRPTSSPLSYSWRWKQRISFLHTLPRVGWYGCRALPANTTWLSREGSSTSSSSHGKIGRAHV